MDVFLALIFAFGGNYDPRGWAFCYGQIMSIAQNQALFSLLGTTYGGDGITTFALPDLRGRTLIGAGTNPSSGTNYLLGQTGGAEKVTLQTTNLPLHNHPADANLIVTPSASTAAGTTNVPGSTLVPAALPSTGIGPTASTIRGYAVMNGSTTLAPNTVSGSVGFAGGGQPFDNRTPYLAITYVIALEGIYPGRN